MSIIDNERRLWEQGLQGIQGIQGRQYQPMQTVDTTPKANTAAECVELLKKRAEKLRSNLSFIESWRAELARIEAMLKAFEGPDAG